MKLFWKVYLLFLVFVVASVGTLATVLSVRESRRSLKALRQEQRLHAEIAASQVEAGYHEQIWPFEMLAAISKEEDVLFWGVVDGGGQVVLSGPPMREGQEARQGLVVGAPPLSEPVRVPGRGGDDETWLIPMRMRTGDKPWTFQLGYHTRAVRQKIRGIVLANALSALLIAVVLIPVSLLATRGLLVPLISLTRAADEMQRGNVDVSLPAPTRDEIGRLVSAFDAMARSIKARDAEIQAKVIALRRARDELEQRVAERTVELTRANEDLTREVAERQRAEAGLRESEAKYRALVEQIPAITYAAALDEASTTTFVSPQIESVLGYTAESYREAPDLWRQRLHPEDRERVMAELHRTHAAQERFSAEYRMVARDGRTVWIQDEARIVCDDEGKPEYLHGVMHDVTKRKRLEEELRRSHDMLEQRVAERTAELTEANRRIRQAQADLVQSEKMGLLGQLVAGVAHEINTPTGAILNVIVDVRDHLRQLVRPGYRMHGLPDDACRWLDETLEGVVSKQGAVGDAAARTRRRGIERALRERGTPDPRRVAEVISRNWGDDWEDDPRLLEHLGHEPVLSLLEHATAVASAVNVSLLSVRKIARIVRDLRFYSRGGRDELEDISINESLDATLVILHNRIKQLAEVETEYAQDLPPVRGGADISQVWSNLLSNACDAIEESSREGRGLIRIATRAEGGRVIVRIFDNAGPIPAEAMEKMYEPFFTTKPIGKGTGLGLGICLGILRRSGGSLSARNEADGVTFEVSLPVAAAGHGGLREPSQATFVLEALTDER